MNNYLWRRTITVVAVSSVSLLAISPAARAHFLGTDSVDGGEIRWETYLTSYDTNRASATTGWNNLGKINIAPDSSSTITDLEWFDMNRGDTGWDGKYFPQSFADGIQLNTYYMAGYSFTKRTGVAAHELGHALGLGHSYSGNLMVDNTPARGSITTPQAHDRADYNALWG